MAIEEAKLLDRNYVYTEATDTYVVFLPGVPKPLVLPGNVHRAMVRAYSDSTGGSTLDEMARAFDLPLQWVTKWKSAFGLTHSCLPLSDEEIITCEDDSFLAEQALQHRKGKLFQEIERKRWASIKKDALEFRRLEAHVLGRLDGWFEDFVPRTSEAVTTRSRRSASKQALVVCPTDLHLGMYANADESGSVYDIPTAMARAVSALRTVLRRATGWGTFDLIYLALGSDFIHSDTDAGTTTSGTPLDVAGTQAELIEGGLELSVALVEACRAVAPVRVVAMANSNHDRLFGLYQAKFLQGWYRHASDVTVNTSISPRQYETFGTTMMMFTHGEGVKPQDLPSVAASENPKAWGKATRREAFIGHLHHNATRAFRGMTVRQLWSMAPSDRWHSRKGFVGTPKGLAAHILNTKEGIIGSVEAPVMEGGDV